jgi:hypothetical protein
LEVRLVRIRLSEPTRDGDRELELVTDLPSQVSAQTIAAAYRQRWRIETAFAQLDKVFEGEIASLAQPRAALLSFALALAAFNTLAVVQAALRKKHGAEKIRNELSIFHLGENVQHAEAALEILLDDSDWTARYAPLTPGQLASELLRLAEYVNLARLRKSRRGPQKPAPPRVTLKNRPHFSTARVLDNARATAKEKKTPRGSKSKSPRRK